MSENNGVPRDAAGRVLPGSRLAIGSGGPKLPRRMNELREQLLDCATEEHIRGLYRSLMASALQGDTAAARLLLEHLIGKPKETVQISGDGKAIDLGAVVAIITSVIGDDQGVRLKLAAAFAKLGGPADGVGE